MFLLLWIALLYLRKSIFLFKVSSQEQFKIFPYNYAALNICPYIKKPLQWPLIWNQGSLVCLFRFSTSEIIAQSFQVVKHMEMRGEWCTWRGPGSSLPLHTYCALCISSTWLSFWCCLQVDGVRIELNSWTPCWCSITDMWEDPLPHTYTH